MVVCHLYSNLSGFLFDVNLNHMWYYIRKLFIGYLKFYRPLCYVKYPLRLLVDEICLQVIDGVKNIMTYVKQSVVKKKLTVIYTIKVLGTWLSKGATIRFLWWHGRNFGSFLFSATFFILPFFGVQMCLDFFNIPHYLNHWILASCLFS